MNFLFADSAQAQQSMGIWFWIALFVLVVFIVAWLLLRSTRVAPPEIHTHAGHEHDHEAHAEDEEIIEETAAVEEPATRAEASVADAPSAAGEPASPKPAVAEVEEAAPVVEVAAAAAVMEAPAPDDLTILEGIGPKVAGILNGAGITTFAQLAATEPEKVRQLLAANGLKFMDPSSWSEQAALASEGRTEDLQKLMDSLRGGRRAG
jgi:predicted flap endonuclease-1-like 5' DNA nuclease